MSEMLLLMYMKILIGEHTALLSFQMKFSFQLLNTNLKTLCFAVSDLLHRIDFNKLRQEQLLLLADVPLKTATF